MSSNEPNDIIKRQWEASGHSPDEHINPEKFSMHEQAKMVLHSPSQRQKYLDELGACIGDESIGLTKVSRRIIKLAPRHDSRSQTNAVASPVIHGRA